MDSAKELFDRLISFKQTYNSESPQQQLMEHCTQFLGSVERVFFDYKEKHDRREPKLDEDDKENLAKAISGFANSSGGVLIRGIKDERLLPKPIADVQRFVSLMLNLAPHVTDPIVPGIDGDWIPSDGETGQDGFGLIYIPESSLSPHRVILNHERIKDRYYIRSGESFLVASHTQLEDMFGRRPRFKLSSSTRIVYGGSYGHIHHLYVLLGIENKGRGTAKSPFLHVKTQPYPIHEFGIDGNGRLGLYECELGQFDFNLASLPMYSQD